MSFWSNNLDNSHFDCSIWWLANIRSESLSFPFLMTLVESKRRILLFSLQGYFILRPWTSQFSISPTQPHGQTSHADCSMKKKMIYGNVLDWHCKWFLLSAILVAWHKVQQKKIGKPSQHLKLVKQSPKSLLNRIYLLLSFCTKSAKTWWTDLISCVGEIRSKSANGLSPSQSSAGDKLHWPALRIVTHTHSMRHLWQFKQQILIYHTKVNYLQRVNPTHPHKPANECHKL